MTENQIESTGEETQVAKSKAKDKAKVKEVQEEQAPSMFSVGAGVKSKNNVPFQPTEQEPISSGIMTSVESIDRKMKDSDNTRPVLVFRFTDLAKERVHTHTEWDIEMGDAKFQDKLEWLKQRLKHIYCEFVPSKNSIPGTEGASSFKDMFDRVASAFNTGKEGMPVFTEVPLWLKLVYGLKGGAKSQLGFPGFPNFIERKVQGKRTLLMINNKQETIIQPKGAVRKPLSPDDLGNDNPAATNEEFPDFTQK